MDILRQSDASPGASQLAVRTIRPEQTCLDSNKVCQDYRAPGQFQWLQSPVFPPRSARPAGGEVQPEHSEPDRYRNRPAYRSSWRSHCVPALQVARAWFVRVDTVFRPPGDERADSDRRPDDLVTERQEVRGFA